MVDRSLEAAVSEADEDEFIYASHRLERQPN
jgi:hypothetical protein